MICGCDVAQSCLTLLDPINGSTPGFPVLHYLLEFAQTHVHLVSDAIQHLIFCLPLLLLPSIFPSMKIFSSGFSYGFSPASGSFPMALHIRFPKYWSFSFSISPSKDYSGLISFRINWFDLLAVQGTFKRTLQHHSLKT